MALCVGRAVILSNGFAEQLPAFERKDIRRLFGGLK
jgi:hypothetical protein